MYPHVSGYKLLVRDTCIRLHLAKSGVNAALRLCSDGTRVVNRVRTSQVIDDDEHSTTFTARCPGIRPPDNLSPGQKPPKHSTVIVAEKKALH